MPGLLASVQGGPCYPEVNLRTQASFTYDLPILPLCHPEPLVSSAQRLYDACSLTLAFHRRRPLLPSLIWLCLESWSLSVGLREFVWTLWSPSREMAGGLEEPPSTPFLGQMPSLFLLYSLASWRGWGGGLARQPGTYL